MSLRSAFSNGFSSYGQKATAAPAELFRLSKVFKGFAKGRSKGHYIK